MAAAKGTDWRTIHRRLNTDMLYSEDLGGQRSVDVEIAESGVTQLKQRDGKLKTMPFLAFKGKQKRLGLGATMCKTLTTLTGTRIVEEWRGWITLIVVKTTYRDQDTGQVETTDAIRIAPKRPKGKQTDHAEAKRVSGADIVAAADRLQIELTDDDKREIEAMEADGEIDAG